MKDKITLTKNHKMYKLALHDHDMNPVIAYGSAGSGKTYSACQAAVKWLDDNKGSQVIVTRPNVSFGDELGFLPGGVQEKLAPWVRPIRDSLSANGLTFKNQEELEWKGRLTFMPLEFVQGLTFDNAFILLDEAENMTFQQLRGFLSRTGRWSKLVICGDIAQTSPFFKNSGLSELLSMVNHFDMSVHTIQFGRDDIVRSDQCKRWISAFEDWDNIKEIGQVHNVEQIKGVR